MPNSYAACELYGTVSQSDKIKEFMLIKDKIIIKTEAFGDEQRQTYSSFLSGETKTGYHQLTQALMILSGAANPVRARTLQKKLTTKESGLIPVFLSYNYFKYESLMKYTDEYKQWILDDIANVWDK